MNQRVKFRWFFAWASQSNIVDKLWFFLGLANNFQFCCGGKKEIDDQRYLFYPRPKKCFIEEFVRQLYTFCIDDMTWALGWMIFLRFQRATQVLGLKIAVVTPIIPKKASTLLTRICDRFCIWINSIWTKVHTKF